MLAELIGNCGWLSYWFPALPSIRQSGGLALEIDAKDVHSALKKANGEIEKLTARFQVGARQRLQFHPTLYAVGQQEPLDYVGGPRRVQVHALERTMAVADFESAGAQLAFVRVRALLAHPNATLSRIVSQLEDAFRRLYRQRNLIVHAGQTASVALDGTLRTVSPLAGAGVDRVVQASALHGIPVLTFAAATEVRLAQSAFGSRCLSELFDFRR